MPRWSIDWSDLWLQDGSTKHLSCFASGSVDAGRSIGPICGCDGFVTWLQDGYNVNRLQVTLWSQTKILEDGTKDEMPTFD